VRRVSGDVDVDGGRSTQTRGAPDDAMCQRVEQLERLLWSGYCVHTASASVLPVNVREGGGAGRGFFSVIYYQCL